MHELLDPAAIPACISDLAKSGKCGGDCERHSGEARPVFVNGWGWFAYCDEAIAEDRRRDLIVTEAVDA